MIASCILLAIAVIVFAVMFAVTLDTATKLRNRIVEMEHTQMQDGIELDSLRLRIATMRDNTKYDNHRLAKYQEMERLIREAVDK